MTPFDDAPLPYVATYRPTYLPHTIHEQDVNASLIERILQRRPRYRSCHIERMTDQIDVYFNDRKIATYMP